MQNFLPVTKQEMQQRGWDQVDFVYITGDAYVDHPSFGSAIISRLLESRGYRVGIIPQPDWRADDENGQAAEDLLCGIPVEIHPGFFQLLFYWKSCTGFQC